MTLKSLLGDGFDLDDICDAVEEITGDRPARGTISAIETGTRGVSAELLSALEKAYRLPDGSINTTYQPRSTPAETEAVA